MEVGRVGEIWRYPVKSLGGERLTDAPVGPAGIPGDRAFGIIDEASGKVLSAKTVPLLLQARARWHDGTVELSGGSLGAVTSDDAGVHDRLSAWLGRPVRLRQPVEGERVPFDLPDDPEAPSRVIEIETPAGRFFDSRSTLHLLSDASLRAASASHPTGDWHPARFRPNLLVTAAGAGFPEDGWVGERLLVGSFEATVRKAAARCVLVARAQPGLEGDPVTFRSLARSHGGTLGVYADPHTTGVVGEGDVVALSGRG